MAEGGCELPVLICCVRIILSCCKAGCIGFPAARNCVLDRGTSVHRCGLVGSARVHTPCPCHPADPSYGAGCSSVGGLPDYDKCTAAGVRRVPGARRRRAGGGGAGGRRGRGE